MTSNALTWYSHMHSYVTIPNVGTIQMTEYEDWMYHNHLRWREDWDYYIQDFGPDGVLNSIRFKNPEDAVAFKLRFKL